MVFFAGLGCPFVFDDCTNAESYPYACSPIGFFLNWCSFDGIHKVSELELLPLVHSVTAFYCICPL